MWPDRDPIGQRLQRAVPIDRAGLHASIHPPAGHQPHEGLLALLDASAAGLRDGFELGRLAVGERQRALALILQVVVGQDHL